MKFNLKRIKSILPKKYVAMYHKNKSKLPAALVVVILLIGLAGKQHTHAGSTEKGIFGGALTGAAIGGIAGGGKGAGYGALAGAALGGIIGSSKDRNRYQDPREKRLKSMEKELNRVEAKNNKLYSKRDKLRDQIGATQSESKRAKYQRQLSDTMTSIQRQENQIKMMRQDINRLTDEIYGGAGKASYRPGGYSAPSYRY